MSYRSSKLKLFLQLIPVIFLGAIGIFAASQLKVVREFLAGASGEPANILIDAAATQGPVPKPWKNLAQGGEMSDWRLTPIKGKVQALAPKYIRLDHIYSFYDVAQKNGDGSFSFNFDKLDPLIDDIVSIGATPYISLSYMPAPMAKDGQITSAPADWNQYSRLVEATIRHYSAEKRIPNIMYEVWNEPDLFGGWKTYGENNYLTLYSYAHQGMARVKGAQPFFFGGPAITALYENWFTKLVEHSQKNNLRLDFFSWHRYDKDVEVFRKDLEKATTWRARYPDMANLQLHITEYGHDSKNHVGYDTAFGAAHTAATSIALAGTLDLGFPFEVEDGKDPKGQERWGRWGMMTHRDFGAKIKPRYTAIRLLNRLSGERLQLLGQGTWVKGLASKNGEVIELALANYDMYGKHVENVPIAIENVQPGSYIMEITDLAGATRKLPISTDTTTLNTNIFMGVSAVMFVRIVPDATAAAPETP